MIGTVRQEIARHLGQIVPSEREGPVWFRARERGASRRFGWQDSASWAAGLEAIFAELEPAAGWDAVELCLTHSYRTVDLSTNPPAIGNIHRGVRGVEMEAGGETLRIAPTDMIAFNLDFPGAIGRAIEGLTAESGTDARPLLAKVSTFEAHQFLVRRDRDAVRVLPLFRGDITVLPEDVTETQLRASLDRLIAWFLTNLEPDGRLPYKYWPSRGEESDDDNTIRQFMATVCLGQLAAATGRADLREAARINLEHNLRRFYRDYDGLGAVELDGSVKLGAVALAALAVRFSPARAAHADIEARLLATVEHLWTPSGAFRTFLVPAERDEFHNFYPGEALVAWAELYAERPDPSLLERIRKSIAYYQDWHRANRNPAFVPWHSQAYARLWDVTRSRELAEFVFAMNDWLVTIQQWDGCLYPDIRGRFFDPEHPEYGPPHASSTGVYLEGLADAHRVALALGDSGRAEAYSRAIERGFRSILQLQFRDDASQYYVSKRRRTYGAIRTEVYDNTLRVDNNQHNAMALLKRLRDRTRDGLRP